MTVFVKGLDGFLRHVGNAQAEAKVLNTVVVTKVAKRAKDTLLAAAAVEYPGGRLSRANNGKGANLLVSYVVKGGPQPSALVMPSGRGSVGLWYLAEAGGQEHQIGKRVARPGKRGLRGQAGFLGRPGIFAAWGPIDHPAIAGKHTWEKGTATAIALSDAAFASEYRSAYLHLFAG